MPKKLIDLVKGNTDKNSGTNNAMTDEAVYREKIEINKRIRELGIIDKIRKMGISPEKLPDIIEEYIGFKQNELVRLADEAWAEYLVAGKYEKENDALRDVLYNKRGVFYLLSIFFGCFFSGAEAPVKEWQSICRIKAQVTGRMKMYGSIENGHYALSVDSEAEFNRDSYLKYLGIELSGNEMPEEINKKADKIKKLIAESREKQNVLKKSIYREIWKKCEKTLFEFMEIYDENGNCSSGRIAEIAEKLTDCFGECGIEFVKCNENDPEDESPKASVINTKTKGRII